MRTDIDAGYILDLNRRFHDEIEADTYDQRMGVLHDQRAVARMVTELEYVLGRPLPRGGKVVDLASGTGNIAVKLALTGWYNEVIAVDISRKSLEVARSVARSQGRDLTIIESDMVRLPFADDSLEFVVGCAFLHHLPDPLAFMAEVRRVLAPGGAFVIIGEPTQFGMGAINVTKFPLVLANRLLRWLRRSRQNVFRWDHDNIDVHDFSQSDARQLLGGFADPRIVTEGFAAPIVDQGLLTPLRLVLGKSVNWVFGGVGRAMSAADRVLFNHVLPLGMRVTLKISGRKQ